RARPGVPATGPARPLSALRRYGARVAHVAVAVALYCLDLAVAHALLLGNGVGTRPHAIQAPFLCAEIQAVRVDHVEGRARNGAARALRGLRPAPLEVHHHLALPVHARLVVPHGVAEVA